MKKTKTKDILIFLFFLSLASLSKYNTFSYAFFWDELGVDIPSAIWSLDNNLSPFMGEKAMGHPPISYLILAIFFKILGISIFSARLAVLLATTMALFYIFKIGEHMYDTKLGITAAITSFFIPIFFSQSGLAMSTTFMIPFAMATIFYFFKKDTYRFIISAALLVLTRELGIILVIVLTATWIINHRPNLRTIAALSIPMAVFAVWVMLNKYMFGWFIYVPTAVTISPNLINSLLSRLLEFFSQYKVLLLLPFLFLKKFRPEEKVLCHIIILYIVFHSSITFLPRYFTFIYPLLVTVSLGTLYTHSKKYAIPFAIVISMVFIFSWSGERTIPPGWMLETNMEYADVIKTHSMAAKFIEQNYQDKKVLTCWPMSSELSDPNMGYISSPVDIVEMQNFNEGFDIIYLSRQSNCYGLLQNIDPKTIEKIAAYELNGKSAEVYKKI
jgi:4-amino-4-deoxy-L-arabinose transferase-like glycosyltransferase